MTRFSISGWRGACLGTLLLTLSALCASAASPKRVLILDPFGRDVAPFSTVLAAFRTTLAKELGEPVEFNKCALLADRHHRLTEGIFDLLESMLQSYN